MKTMFACIILAFAFGTAQAAFTPEEFKLDHAQQLLDVCTAPTTHPDYLEAYGFRAGYFTGAMHYHRALARGPEHKAIVCPHHTVTRAEAITVFITWAKDNPQYMSEEPIQALMRAAVAKWPCKPADQAMSTGGTD
jgi:hypothetical protein